MTDQLPGMEAVEKSATISDDGVYRYDLTRRWGTGLTALWIMLNPSTADAEADDQTIRTVSAISEHHGYGRLAVVNLYALRSRDPDELLHHPDPIGRGNREMIERWLADPDVGVVVAGWGAWRTKHKRSTFLPPRLNVEQMARDAGHDLFCINRLREGEPRHPLYAPFTSPLIVWSV